MAEPAVRGRGAAPADTDLWRRAVRDVAPLHSRPAPGAAAMPIPPPGVPPPPIPVPPPRTAPPVPPLGRCAGVDRATAERLRRGRRAIEARLDLHGMTQEQAHRALAAWIAESRRAGRRCLLVITGRGSGGGVLREAVPRWLEEPALRRDVLAIAPAQPRDGGGGALYLLTRRPDRTARRP